MNPCVSHNTREDVPVAGEGCGDTAGSSSRSYEGGETSLNAEGGGR